MKQASFLWSGCPGTYGRRQLTGVVLETRTAKQGNIEYLLKAPELNLPKWIAAEFVTELLTDGFTDDVAPGFFHEGEWTPIPTVAVDDAAPAVKWTPRQRLMMTAAVRFFDGASSAYVAIEETVDEWRWAWSYLDSLRWYDAAGPNAIDRLAREVDAIVFNRKAAYTAKAMQTA